MKITVLFNELIVKPFSFERNPADYLNPLHHPRYASDSNDPNYINLNQLFPANHLSCSKKPGKHFAYTFQQKQHVIITAILCFFFPSLYPVCPQLFH